MYCAQISRYDIQATLSCINTLVSIMVGLPNRDYTCKCSTDKLNDGSMATCET